MRRAIGNGLPSRRADQRGFTLVEFIVVIVILGIVASMVAAGITAYTGIGRESIITRDAQLAQERLELILAERLAGGFPRPDSGMSGPDPCQNGLDFDSCQISVYFRSYDIDGNIVNDENCLDEEAVQYCDVELNLENGPDFFLRLYNY